MASDPIPPQPTATAAPATERVLLFTMRRHAYALRVSAVSGLADCGTIRPVHGAPRSVLGVTEWRGDVLTVLDLPRLLGHHAVPGKACLIRLAPPLRHAAFYLPTTVTVATVSAGNGPGARSIADERFLHDGRAASIVDPVAVVRKLESELWEYP